MKNILFILTNFRHGGTNKSLENLMSLIDTKKYQVDVFAMEHYGPYKDMLPNCKILPEDKWVSALIAHWSDMKGWAKMRSLAVKTLRNIAEYFNVELANVLFKKSVNRLESAKVYDAVIAYSEGVPTTFVSHLKHPNNIAWIHCDYSNYLKLNNNPDETKIYESYRSIVCVSQFTQKGFLAKMSVFTGRVYSLHNILNLDIIHKKSVEKISDIRFINDKFTIITIGTFYAIKRLSAIPDIARQLQKRGCNFRWYVIAIKGSLAEFNNFSYKIEEFGLSDYVIFLGEKRNPYSYLKKSNLFVSLSVTEACPYVINESQSLHVPIICTDFPSAPEFVENGKIGYISPIETIVDKIELLIKDKSAYQRIKSNASKHTYNNSKLMNDFYKIVNNDFKSN